MTYSFHLVVTIAVCTACLSMLAVSRAKYIQEVPMIVAGRNLVAGGWAIFACRCIYLMVEYGSLPVHPLSLIAILTIAVGTTYVGLAILLSGQQSAPCNNCPHNQQQTQQKQQ